MIRNNWILLGLKMTTIEMIMVSVLFVGEKNIPLLMGVSISIQGIQELACHSPLNDLLWLICLQFRIRFYPTTLQSHWVATCHFLKPHCVSKRRAGDQTRLKVIKEYLHLRVLLKPLVFCQLELQSLSLHAVTLLSHSAGSLLRRGSVKDSFLKSFKPWIERPIQWWP